MTTPEFFETPIPDEAEQWDALGKRVVNAATGSRRGGFDWLSSSPAGWVAASLVIGAVIAFMMLPTGEVVDSDARARWAALLAPSDDLGHAIAGPDGPPAIGMLLIRGAKERAR